MALVFPRPENATIENPSPVFGSVDMPSIPGVILHIAQNTFVTATFENQEWYVFNGGTHWVLCDRVANGIVGDIKKLFPK